MCAQKGGEEEGERTTRENDARRGMLKRLTCAIRTPALRRHTAAMLACWFRALRAVAHHAMGPLAGVGKQSLPNHGQRQSVRTNLLGATVRFYGMWAVGAARAWHTDAVRPGSVDERAHHLCPCSFRSVHRERTVGSSEINLGSHARVACVEPKPVVDPKTGRLNLEVPQTE